MQIHALDSNDQRGEIDAIKRFFNLSASIKSQTPIGWSNATGDILAVDWYDLSHSKSIPWKDINIVVTETFQQVVDAIDLFDTDRSYILVTESFAEPATINAILPSLKIIKTFTRFVEVFEYGQHMYNPVSQYAWSQAVDRVPAHDFFCLIGRRSWLRSHLINRLSTFDISNSLVKYHGQQHEKSKAPDLDPVNYHPHKFYYVNNSFEEVPWLIPAKLIPTELYKNFYFEVQHETDPYHSKGWQTSEFHLTEKTIKPLIMGVPCMMFGAAGYNTWLKNCFDIDLSLGQFDLQFDQYPNNLQRLDLMLMQVPDLIKNKVSLNTQDQHTKNMLGFAKLRDFSFQQLRELYTLIQSL